MNSFKSTVNKLIELYFAQPKILYSHLFDSYNTLIDDIIPYILINENNYFYENIDKTHIYLHGFKISNIRIKPSTFDNNTEIKFPIDARKNQLNYFGSVIVDVTQIIEIVNLITNEKVVKTIGNLEHDINLANIPIMVKSKYCSTYIKQDLHGECKYDPGGYFIVNGAEKVVMCMEKIVDNKVLITTKKDTSFPKGLIYTAQINSKKNDWSEILQILNIKNKKDMSLYVTMPQLVDIPLFIFMRALGLESDYQILSYITHDLHDIEMINLIRPSINILLNDELIKTKAQAIDYIIPKLKKNKYISTTNEELAKIQKHILLEKIFKNDLLPHLGQDIPKKIVFISYMVNKLLSVILNRADPDDRDALHNKRIETPGILIAQLFKQNWRKLLNDIGKQFKKKNQSDQTPINMIHLIKPSIIENGLKSALAKGVWGVNKSKRGVAQAYQRLSWFQSVSSLRRILSPSLDDSSSQITSIRHINPNQMQMLCMVETPEGQKVGLVKSLAMSATITSQNQIQYDIIKNILKYNEIIKHPYDINPLEIKSQIKIFLNGELYAMCDSSHAYEIYNNLKQLRRKGIIDLYTSILFDFTNKEIKIFYDGGRLIRPILIVNNNKLNFNDEIIQFIDEEYENELTQSKAWKKILDKYSNLIEYEDIESLNYLLIAEDESVLNESIEVKQRKIDYENITNINRYGDYRWLNYSHCEMHGWLSLGTIAANIPFSNHNYCFRNSIHFSQAKQAIGIYLTSYKKRIDISQILYHPQVPLTQTQGMKFNGLLNLPFGENTIIAICSYTGYNQEDSIILNQSSVDRGLFRADTLKKYHSEITKNPSTSQDDMFTKPDKNKVTNMKYGNYDKLNEKGYVPEETVIDNGDIIIGKISPIQPTKNNKTYKDNSEIYKSLIPGVVDSVHTGIYNVDRYEMFNIRVRVERIPYVGDKFTNFHGGKGTVGILYPQQDMPFTESGIVPDLIFNPHAFPTRMSVAYFIECLAAKEAALTGKIIDATPYNNFDVMKIPESLHKLGYSSYGTEKMYCGITGKQMEAEIFIGPAYTLRLKHMVLDKVHARARGPKQALTRQPLEGRSRDGGLKIGEMEKDAIISHGMGQFLKERFMETSDIAKVQVCDLCGMFASKVIDKDYYKCKSCKNTTKISSVVIPYACKLLFQELTAVNILPRIYTESNIYTNEI